jgi:glycosyltransferase involved in cell wall biosynthesis
MAIPPGPLVVYVGRVNQQKGTDLLLEAFESLKGRVEGIQLAVAGPADQFGTSAGSELTERLLDLGGHWLGAVDESSLVDVYNMADVFAMPTRDAEMFGMAALEAQACGLPVVCSLLGGLPEAVGPGLAIFVPPGDAVALAGAIESALARGRAIAGEISRRNAVTLSWEAVTNRLDRVYRSAIEGRARSR